MSCHLRKHANFLVFKSVYTNTYLIKQTRMKTRILKSGQLLLICLLANANLNGQTVNYPIVETNVTVYYDNSSVIDAPTAGEAFYGQDAHYSGYQPSYTDNGNGTITDNVTGLMWQQDMGEKISYADAIEKANTMTLGGHNDWRVPTIKELYSLILFSGSVNGETPIEDFIDTDYFIQPLGNEDVGERLIDAQTWSATEYLSTTMAGDQTVFGVNFLDGRIKGYPKYEPGSDNTTPRTMYFRMVRGNALYGINSFVDNQDGTITDNATGLMWQQADDGIARDWEDALSYAENLSLADCNDWRLPNAKELQSIVDYSRCPDITNSPAIDPIFSTTEITDPDGNTGQYPYFWTSTSHLDGNNPYTAAVYIAFGEAQGKMNNQLMDVHGAGAQRSDPKSGDPDNYPDFFGPQGDVRYVFNYVRCVRNAQGTSAIDNNKTGFDIRLYPNPTSDMLTIIFDDFYTDINIKIINFMGKNVKELNRFDTNTVILSVENLATGCYFVQINTNNKQAIRKIFKQ